MDCCGRPGLALQIKEAAEADNLVRWRHVLVLWRQVRGKIRLRNYDRQCLAQLYRWFSSILRVLVSVQPEAVIRWHWVGFRCFRRWNPVQGKSGLPLRLIFAR